MRIATFNVQNMRLRDPGGTPKLDGAVDGDVETMPDPSLDRIDRQLTAQVLAAVDADIVSLQEVFDSATLDFFHDSYLRAAGCAPYPHRICLPGNDGRGLCVAAMSRVAPLAGHSHAALTPADCPGVEFPDEIGPGRIFRRDCLELVLPDLTLFICHFKAPYPDATTSFLVRRAEALAVRWLVEQRYLNPAKARWIILGDLNEPSLAAKSGTSALAPLTQGFAVDLTRRLPGRERWSYSTPHEHVRSCPDRILISPALDRDYANLTPEIYRAGMDYDSSGAGGRHLPLVGDQRPHASDHAAIYVDIA